MELDRSPEPKRPVFVRPEHEWLRIAAMVEPDWEELRRLPQDTLSGKPPEFSWQNVVDEGQRHQLGGVVRWRFLDERLDEVCPEWVREEALGHLEELARKGRDRWEQVAGFCALLGERGIPYAVRSGPVQYAPLGITHWPREWRDVEVEVTAGEERALDALAGAAGARVTKWWPSWWQLDLPGGVRIDLGSSRPVAGGTHDCRTWGFWRRPPVPASAFGVELHLLDPVLRVLDMAWCTWNSCFSQAGPWPLWALARIKAVVATVPDFDWIFLGEMLRENVRLSAAVPLEAANLWADAALRDATMAAWRVLWVLHMADRVYAVLPPGGAAELVAPLAVRAPDLFSSAGRHFDEREGEYTCGVYRWGRRPTDQELLFDYYIRGVEGRLACGLWEEVPGYEPRVMRIDRGGRRVHRPKREGEYGRV